MNTNLLDYFKITLSKSSASTAAIYGDRTVTFDVLADNAKKLSRIITHEMNGVIRKPVAAYLDKSIESIVADLAIIYSGNAYMNLDTKTPMQRISNILNLIQPALIITNQKYIINFQGILRNGKIVNIDSLNYDVLTYSQKDIERTLEPIIDTDPLCIINTSGSTGVPKGVVLNHRSFIDFTDWAINATGIGENEIIGSMSPLVFDIYSFELCMLVALGSTIMIIPDGIAAFPARILQLLQQHKVSYIFWVPTIMANIANMDLLSRVSLPTLKSVWFAGEVFPTKQFNYWRRHLPHARFINLYGPIEITLDCTYYIVEREISDDEPIPIGYACKNTDILLLNDENKLVKVNEEGELCVRGTSLAMGYYNNPEKTASSFVQNPLNKAYPEIIYRTGDVALINEKGEIIFKGRKDTLVKHFGYRIELGEIEHVIINTLELVKNGCIVYNHDKKEIVFYYESADDTTVAEMRKCIASALPKYMIPTIFINVNELPLNTNGKIDRLKLNEMTTG